MMLPATPLADFPARLSDIPRRWNGQTPDAPALHENGVVWSYARLWAAVEAGADLLRELDVRPGDRVMVVGENCAAQVALIFAAALVDAWVVVVNARLSAREMEVIRDHCQARRMIFTGPTASAAHAHGARVAAVSREVELVGGLSIGPLNTACSAEPVATSNAEQVAALIYTTGTTGHPKGVMLTHRNLLFVADGSGCLRELTQQDRVYGVLPISHVFGLASVMLATLYAGACLYLVPRYSAEALQTALAQDGITMLQGVPAMYARLLEMPRQSGERIKAPALRFIYAGGSALDPALKAAVEQLFGKPLHNGYGMTESSPTISSTRMDAPRTDASAGMVAPGVEIRLVDSHDQEVSPGEPGELWVRGPNVMKGYYREPALTAGVMREGGWLNTGDVARLESDGALFIVGRTKELIIRSGFNVYPAEVEAALNAHPAVTQSAVVGRRVADGNEEVVAFIEVHPSRTVTVAELQAYLATLLSPYKCPSIITILPVLPAAATGKILKGELKNLAQQMYGK
ncbi:AMP-binding protein [Herbaspirillum sp. RTI4]|uniref:class I adenylate-forming enzyme family protein n=1 Tax=Herbaspirillum sp. RTI4 TaxID=3048640 RepID=UPI002AB3B3D7|nr:AMP-binding protein [Herbaspirillum sp. RTI4]MDY7577090.1 AMP-binding protein [Herbaspirillum sp. RTI4]MEA9982270.1 AMP-binding protein [Herbaspirillum sp. RTI4]